MISTIIFDLSEVYLRGLKGVEGKIETILGASVNYKVQMASEAEEFFHGEITEEVFWHKVIDRNNWKIDVETLKLFVRENMTEIDGTREIIEKLKENGYVLGLLSVHGREWIDHCEGKFEYHRLFHSVMYSFEVGICKPEPKAYELMLLKLKVAPENCVFIDDSLTNIETAKKLGMKTIHFEDAKQLREELKRLSIRLTTASDRTC